MLEKLITNLKNSLPGPLRKKMGMVKESDDNIEESEENELQKFESDESDGPSVTSDEEKKKKRISMIIRVVVICGIAYFALDEFVLKKNKGAGDQGLDEILAKAPVRKKRKGIVKPDDKAGDTKTAAIAANGKSATDAPAKTGEASTSAEVSNTLATGNVNTAAGSTPPIENVNILDKNDPLATAPVNITADQMQTESSTDTGTSQEIVSSKVVDTSVDHKIDQLIDHVDQTAAPETAAANTSTEEVNIPSQLQALDKKTPKKAASMASKIVEDVSETLPPVYDQVGRGLVYNCKDKYWACVDKPSYVVCNKNMKWNELKGNTAECIIQNIYNTDEDCAKIQKYNVSTSQPTAFCK
ncbi:MAG: hypothetical protein H7336_07300 [Bacteriovorax sp.]|nr:hypothetical protein [Bacteriovorax sp.]